METGNGNQRRVVGWKTMTANPAPAANQREPRTPPAWLGRGTARRASTGLSPNVAGATPDSNPANRYKYNPYLQRPQAPGMGADLVNGYRGMFRAAGGALNAATGWGSVLGQARGDNVNGVQVPNNETSPAGSRLLGRDTARRAATGQSPFTGRDDTWKPKPYTKPVNPFVAIGGALNTATGWGDVLKEAAPGFRALMPRPVYEDPYGDRYGQTPTSTRVMPVKPTVEGTNSFIGAGGQAVRGNNDDPYGMTLTDAQNGGVAGTVWLNDQLPVVAPYYPYTSGGYGGGGGGWGRGGGGGGWGGGGGRYGGYDPMMGLYSWNFKG